MTNLIGLNILTFDGEIWEFLRETQPAWVTITASNAGDHIQNALAVLQASPHTNIAYRAVYLNGIHMDSFERWWEYAAANQNPGEGVMAAAVRLFFEAYGPAVELAKTNPVWLYTINETGAAPDNDPDYATYINWHIGLEGRARELGVSLCHSNTGTGNPGHETYALYGPLFERMQGGDSVLGIHEYWQGSYANDVPWTVTRYNEYVKVMEQTGFFVPMVVTEWGFDKWDDPQLSEGGWVGTGFSQAECGLMLVDCGKRYYIQPAIAGVCLFCWGGWGRWKEFYSIHAAHSIQQVLKENLIPMENAPPTPDVCQDALQLPHIPGDVQFKCLAEPVRVRSAPVVDDCSVTEHPNLAPDQIIDGKALVYNGYSGENDIWVAHKIGDEQVYSAVRYNNQDLLLALPVDPPDPPEKVYYLRADDPAMNTWMIESARVIQGLSLWATDYEGEWEEIT